MLPGVLAGLLRVDSQHPASCGYSLLISGILFAPGLVFLLLMKPGDGLHAKSTAKASGRAPFGLILVLVAIQLLQGTGEGSVRCFLNVYLSEGLRISTSGVGVLMSVAQLLPVPVSMIVPVFLDRWGNRRVFVGSSLVLAGCLLPIVLIPHWGAASLGYTGIMAMAWVWRTPFVLHRLELVEPAWRPVVNGALNLALGLSWGGTALAGGYVIAARGYATFFLLAAILTAAGSLLFLARFRRAKAPVGTSDSAPT